MQFKKTQFYDADQRLLYGHVQGTQLGRYKQGRALKPRKVSFWSMFHQFEQEKPKRVGPTFATQAELLANLANYGREWGF